MPDGGPQDGSYHLSCSGVDGVDVGETSSGTRNAKLGGLGPRQGSVRTVTALDIILTGDGVRLFAVRPMTPGRCR